MTFTEICRTRRSIRRFSPQPLTPVEWRAVIADTLHAPSAGNLQSYEIVSVRDPAKRAELAAAALDQEYVAQAPVVLVFLALPQVAEEEYGMRGAELYAVQDATIACTYAMLSAHAHGLGAVWVGAFQAELVAVTVGAVPGDLPVAMLAIGHADESPRARPRKLAAEMVREL